MSNPLRNPHFWLALLLVAALVSFSASRFGWGQLRRATGIPINIIADLPTDNALEGEVLVCGGADPDCLWEVRSQTAIGSAEYKFSGTQTCGTDTPATGRYSTDATAGDFSDITAICLHSTTDNEIDISEFLATLNAGSTIWLQRVRDSTESLVLQTTATGTEVGSGPTGYFNFPVNFYSSNNTPFKNNQNYAVQFNHGSMAVAVKLTGGFLNQVEGGGVDVSYLVV